MKVGASLAAGVAAVLAFAKITNDVITGDSTAGDHLLLRRGHLLATSEDGQWLTPAAKWMSMAGNWQGAILLGVLVWLLARRQGLGWRPFLHYAAIIAGTGVLILAVKFLVSRPRPAIVPALEHAPFASFPSGHSAYAVAMYSFLVCLAVWELRLSRWQAWVLGLLTAGFVALVGLSRVYLGTHYPTDVIAGFLLGVPWLLVVLAHYRKRQPEARPAA